MKGMNWVHYNTPLMIGISTSQQRRSSTNPLADCELKLAFQLFRQANLSPQREN
jgi:hypothetical protein